MMRMGMRRLGRARTRMGSPGAGDDKKTSVIPLLEDTLKEWGFLQVMTQVIGQELYQAALHPLPVGSRIMGGQGKRIVSHKRSYPLILRHHEWG
jgi:hypothetical protein